MQVVSTDSAMDISGSILAVGHGLKGLCRFLERRSLAMLCPIVPKKIGIAWTDLVINELY